MDVARGEREMILEYLQRHKSWSLSTFGEGQRTEGLCKHIAKELEEIRQSPNDLMEWVDVIILAFDGAWRAGYSPSQIVIALVEKQAINFERKWKLTDADEPVEHEHD